MWPCHPDAAALEKARTRPEQLFADSPKKVRAWASTRRKDPHHAALLERNACEVRKGRRIEIFPAALEDGAYVAHPELMVVQGDKGRACDDCTASGWTHATVPTETVAQPGTDDVLDYAARLLLRDPACKQ